MVICEKCSIKNKADEGNNDSILNFPFKIYENKYKLKFDLLKYIKADREFLLKKNEKYQSNIIHELVYKLVKCKFNDKQYRKQHIWALEILSEFPEYSSLLLEKNSRNEIPIEAYVRLAEDNHSKQYEYILELLRKNSDVPIILISRLDNNLNNELLNDGILVREEQKRVVNPQIAILTNQYHNLQEKLFAYFEKKYPEEITKCEICNKSIDIFLDLEKIGNKAKLDTNIKIMIKNIEHIIHLRREGILLSQEDEVNRRHKHIITYFERLLDILNNVEN